MTDPLLRYEHRGALAEVVGAENGLTETEWRDLAAETTAIVRALEADRAATPYRALPHDPAASQVERVLEFAEARRGRFDDVVVLGIGGSALGAVALRTALLPAYWNALPPHRRGGRPRLWVTDNVDPDEFGQVLEAIDPKRTLFSVVSKSGTTAETVAQFLVVLDLLRSCVGEDRLADHLVVTTDARRGLLRPVVGEMKLPSFAVPDGVGGRFSVLSPVGLLPAALVGIDVRALLAGAAEMDRRCAADDFEANPAARGAAVQIGLYRKGKPMSVWMPYAAALKDVADWFRQLWAESLGKRRPDGTPVGPTPIKALGVTDQHSQVQLYREGPADKVFTILSVERFGRTLPLPAAPAGLEGFDYLRGHDMAGLLAAEERATRWALAHLSRRPVARIVLPQVRPETVGALLQMLMVQTSIAGAMLGIDPYNQPGVEAGKVATRALMGMDGPIEDPVAKGLPPEAATYEALRRLIEESGV